MFTTKAYPRRLLSAVICVAISVPLHAGNAEPGSCGLMHDPIQARHCMLVRQIEDTRVGGDRAGGSAGLEIASKLTAPGARAEVLNARAQMAEMAGAANEDGVVLGPVGSVGDAPVFGAVLALLILFGLLGGNGSSGPPISPS